MTGIAPDLPGGRRVPRLAEGRHRPHGAVGVDGQGDAAESATAVDVHAHGVARLNRTRSPAGDLLQGGEVQVKTKNTDRRRAGGALVGLLWYQCRVFADGEQGVEGEGVRARRRTTSADNLRSALNGTTRSKKKTKTHDVATEVMLAAVPVDAAEAAFLRTRRRRSASRRAPTWQSITPSVPDACRAASRRSTSAITVQGTEDQLASYRRPADLKRIFVVDNLSITAGAAAPPATGAPQGVRATFIRRPGCRCRSRAASSASPPRSPRRRDAVRRDVRRRPRRARPRRRVARPRRPGVAEQLANTAGPAACCRRIA